MTPGPAPDDSTRTKFDAVPWSVFSTAVATSALLYLHRYSFAFIKPSLAKEWNLNNTQLGQFDSAFATCYSLFQLPLAVGADLWGAPTLLLTLIVAWTTGLAIVAWGPSPRWVGVGQAVLGCGQSAVYACLTRLARLWYPERLRTTLQGVVSVLAGRLGALAASLVFSTLLLGFCGLSWRAATTLLAATAAILGVVVALVVREPTKPELDVAATPRSSGRLAVRRGMGATTAALAVQAVLSTFADNVYSNWLPQFLSQVHGLEFRKMGLYAALPLLGGAVAGLVGGWLNDRLAARLGARRWARAGVAIVGKSVAALILFAALQQFDRPYLFCGLLFFVKAFGDWSLVSALGVIADSGGRATASLFALVNTIAGAGQIAAPLAFGYLADHYGWRQVFVVVAVAYLLCAAAWCFVDGDAGSRDAPPPASSA